MPSLKKFVESDLFRRSVIALIVFNAAHIGLETYPGVVARYGVLLERFDSVILGLFSLELLLRLAAHGPAVYFRKPWSWFDMAVIGAGFFPKTEFLTVFRLLRVLRIMRTIRILPGLKKLSEALFASIPALANVLVILGLVFYIYGAAGSFLYGGILPERFGTLDKSLLTLFEVLTLEAWSPLMRSLLPVAPHAWAYFLSFILIATVFALNAVVGILVGRLQYIEEGDEMDKVRESLARIEARLEKLVEKLGR